MLNNKKVIGLIMSGMLSVSMLVGCTDDTVEKRVTPPQQEQTIEQPKVQDEDLNQEYKQEINNKEELEQAKALIEKMATECLSDFRYDIYVDEESNTVILRIHVTAADCAVGLQDGSYYELADSIIENSEVGKEAFDKMGLNANYSVMLMDLDTKMVYFASVNGEVLYDAAK